MDLSTTNVNFKGKKEIIYGLKKAAQEAKNIEINRSYAYGPHPIIREANIYEANGALKAYADMVTKDNKFNTVIKGISEDKVLTKELGETLQPKDVPFGKINPFGEFVKAISNSFKKNNEGRLTDNVKMFFKVLKCK